MKQIEVKLQTHVFFLGFLILATNVSNVTFVIKTNSLCAHNKPFSIPYPISLIDFSDKFCQVPIGWIFKIFLI